MSGMPESYEVMLGDEADTGPSYRYWKLGSVGQCISVSRDSLSSLYFIRLVVWLSANMDIQHCYDETAVRWSPSAF